MSAQASLDQVQNRIRESSLRIQALEESIEAQASKRSVDRPRLDALKASLEAALARHQLYLASEVAGFAALSQPVNNQQTTNGARQDDNDPTDRELYGDVPPSKRRKRESLKDIRRSVDVPDAGWIDSEGKPHLVRIRNAKWLNNRFSHMWFVMDALRSRELAQILDAAQRPEVTASIRDARDELHSALDQCQQEAYFLYLQQIGGPRVADAFITDNPFNGTERKDLVSRYNWAVSKAEKEEKATDKAKARRLAGRKLNNPRKPPRPYGQSHYGNLSGGHPHWQQPPLGGNPAVNFPPRPPPGGPRLQHLGETADAP